MIGVTRKRVNELCQPWQADPLPHIQISGGWRGGSRRGGIADALAREHLSLHPPEVWATQARALENSEMPISLIAAWAAAVRSRLRADMARIASLN